MDSHPSFGNLRTFVDPASNTVVLPGLVFRRDVGKIMKGALPIGALPAAIHEFTHHWCFHSPVGSALAMLKLDSVHSVFYAQRQADLFSSAATLDVALQMLRPLAEGLALFAEFDLMPGLSDVRTPIGVWLLDLFAKDIRAQGKANIDQLLAGLLRLPRNTDAWVGRKGNLLAQPLDVRAGGYLPRYLFVKSLWNKFQATNSTLVDAELFLCYVSSFFYDDYHLAGLLLGRHDDPRTSIDFIVRYVVGRIQLLTKADLVAPISAYHEVARRTPLSMTVRTNPPDSILQHGSFLPGISIDEQEFAAGRAVIDRYANELFGGRPDVPDNISRSSSWVLRLRELIWLGGVKANVEVNDQRRVVVSVGGEPVYAGNALGDVGPREGEGAAEVFFSTNYNFLFLVASIQSEAVSIAYLRGEVPEWLQDELCGAVVDREANLRVACHQDQYLAELRAKQDSYGAFQQLKSTIEQVCKNTYSEVALHSVDAAMRGNCKAAMMERGFWDILGANLNRLNQFALLGDLVSSNLPKSERELVLKRMGIFLQLIEGAVSSYGFTKSQIDTENLSCFI